MIMITYKTYICLRTTHMRANFRCTS